MIPRKCVTATIAKTAAGIAARLTRTATRAPGAVLSWPRRGRRDDHADRDGQHGPGRGGRRPLLGCPDPALARALQDRRRALSPGDDPRPRPREEGGGH